MVLRAVRSGGGRLNADEIAADLSLGHRASNDSDDIDLHAVQDGDAVAVWMRSPVVAGEKSVRVRWRGHAKSLAVKFADSEADSFGDGLPDALRLHSVEDRDAFRRWFWRLVYLQSELSEQDRAAEINDCGALLRYAYRETLMRHDAAWAESQHVGDIAFPSVAQWRYPETMLRAGLFRVRPGSFARGDEINGVFAQFADAHALMSWNTYRVGRTLKAAKPGDLIFYRQLEQNSPYHSMVITGDDAGWAVYHTGPIGSGRGEMRRMTLDDLLHHPDARWRPVAENSNFLGVFRWNLLREGE